MSRYKILDWYVHQGHQYEFFKGDHDYFLVNPDGSKPDWNEAHRPLGKNVKLISEKEARLLDFDIVIVRTPVKTQKYKYFIDKGSAPIAVIQTIDHVTLLPEIKHIVWNSMVAMRSKPGFYRGRKQHFIVHGYDPNEFVNMNLEKNGRVLTVANHFKKRDRIMGYDTWKFVKSSIKECDVVGSKNDEIVGAIKHKDTMEELIKTYNEYSIFFNPTRFSAMPRSRVEAAMCGMPIVSTANYDFKNFFRPGKDAMLSNDKRVLRRNIFTLMRSEQARIDLGLAAREAAIKHFHIDDFLKKWDQVFDAAVE
jgi:glycosyltransferase involved in cell wall biosynthesis